MLKEAFVGAMTIYPGYTPRILIRKIRFLAAVFRYRTCLGRFAERLSISGITGINPLGPNILGMAVWPYINNTWSVEEKLDIIASHYETIVEMSPALNQIGSGSQFNLADLNTFSTGVTIIIDRSPWFFREGELVVNIFQEDLRVASIAFTLSKDGEHKKIIIGAIQGIHSGIPSDKSLAIFKQLTKDFKGLRPRSLLLEIIKMVARYIDTDIILAVADKNRHHRHPFFGKDVQDKKFHGNYDELWLESKGVLNEAIGFYDIPLLSNRKELSEIPSRKRSMYRFRYQILEDIDHLVRQAL